MQPSSVKLPLFDLINVLTGEGMKEGTGREYYGPNAIDTYTATMYLNLQMPFSHPALEALKAKHMIRFLQTRAIMQNLIDFLFLPVCYFKKSNMNGIQKGF